MINYLHSLFHRPERGWDPVPSSHSETYAQLEWSRNPAELVSQLENKVGSLEGKRVLDLGGGPGHYSVAFAQRGALVTWHDVSRRYFDFIRNKAREMGVSLEFSLGYLEDARHLFEHPFDLVFCRICWCYCMQDRRFAAILYSLVKPGGAAYIDTNTPEFDRPSGLRSIQYFLNNRFWIKVGHPHPPHGRLASLFQSFPLKSLSLDYSSSRNDKLYFVKPDEIPK